MNLLVSLIGQDHHVASDIGPLIAGNVAVHSETTFHLPRPGAEITFIIVAAETHMACLESSDAALILIDGQTGLSPTQLELWSMVSDMSIPRGVLAYNSVGTRADFDEVVAIAERMLDDDILVRYMPIVSEDESELVGQFDILNGQIITWHNTIVESRPGDPEHMQLTFERREDLVETLTHFSEDESLIEALSAGMPTNTPGLARAFTADDIVSVTAIDNGVGVPVLSEWLDARRARWVPSVTILDTDISAEINVELNTTVNATDSVYRVAIGIDAGIARTWGPSDKKLSCDCEFDVNTACVVTCDALTIGQSLAEAGVRVELVAPSF